MKETTLEDLQNRLECVIGLLCLSSSSDKERTKVMVNTLGLNTTARILGKDPGNLSRALKSRRK